VSVCVCMYVCVCARARVHAFVRVCARACAYVRVRVRVFASACLYVRVCVLAVSTWILVAYASMAFDFGRVRINGVCDQLLDDLTGGNDSDVGPNPSCFGRW
jgi:hypothetical protein